MSTMYLNFKKVKTIIPNTVCSTTVDTAQTILATTDSTGTYSIGQNSPISLYVTLGNVWINPSTVATSTGGFKLVAGDTLDLIVKDALSIVSDSTTATIQAIVWDR